MPQESTCHSWKRLLSISPSDCRRTEAMAKWLGKIRTKEILKRDVLLIEAKTNTETPYLHPQAPILIVQTQQYELSLHKPQQPDWELLTPSHWWWRGTVPSLKVLSTPGRGGGWQISQQGNQLREVGQQPLKHEDVMQHISIWNITQGFETIRASEQRFKGDFTANCGFCL